MQPLARRLVERSPSGVRPAVRLVARTVEGAGQHRLPGLAAEIAFWTLLSLPALLLAAIAVAGVVGNAADADLQQQAIDRIAEVSSVALTSATIEGVVRPVLRDLLDGGGIGIASFAFLTAVWTASRAVRVVLTTLTIAYARRGLRAPWKDRLVGFGLTLGGLAAGIVLLPLLLAGPNFGEQLADWLQPARLQLADIWRAAYWPGVIVSATLALSVLYHLGVPGHTPWRGDLPGAALATTLWLAGSAGLRLYGTWVLDGEGIYGSLAGPIVALLWVWVTGLAVLLGAELNAQISRQWLDPRPATAAGAGASAVTETPTPSSPADEPRSAR